MIYIFVGTDAKKRNALLKKILGNKESIRVSSSHVSSETLSAYARDISLFGEIPSIVVDGVLSNSDSVLSPNLLSELKDSSTIFIFTEDKLLASQEKKYKKYAEIERFEEKKTAPKGTPSDTFALADAFGRRDKMTAWMLYCDAVAKGMDPEPVSGMLFWKIKTMMFSGTRVFNSDELRKQSSDLVSLYHRAHKGECDFVIGLEQFILSSLSK